jgi:hypothetical protein
MLEIISLKMNIFKKITKIKITTVITKTTINKIINL